MQILEAEQWLPAPLERVFAFFSDARNLERITPTFLSFRIVTPSPIVMRVGQRIDYRLRIRGFPVSWQSEISVWEPPHRFVDEQRRGPYRVWIHEHTFATEGDGTRVRDRVQFRAPGGALMERWIVRPDVERIFDHRARTLAGIFTADANVGQSR